jgi:hypothetical protein
MCIKLKIIFTCFYVIQQTEAGDPNCYIIVVKKRRFYKIIINGNKIGRKSVDGSQTGPF